MKWTLRVGPDLVALLAGVAIFAIFYGPKVLLAQNPYLSAPLGDVASELAGYFHFARDKWRFPVFVIPTINIPEGSNLLFTGGIPLVALIAKGAQSALGTTPNLFGVWYLLCCVLQTHSIFFLMRQVTDERPYLLASASLVGGVAYAFITRTGHPSLFCHFICIYAVALVIATTNERYTNRTIIIGLGLLAQLAMLIFAYLAICNTILFLGGILSLVWLKRLDVRGAVLVCVAFAAIEIVVAYAAGYFWGIGRVSPSAIMGFSEFGLNLGALIYPPKSILFPNNVLIPFWWEGAFYLGLGVIALWGLLIATEPMHLFRLVVRHWPISLVFAVLALYSLSNRVSYLDITLVTFPLPEFMTPVLGMARTAGRLFWPVGYLLIAGAISLCVVKLPRFALQLVIASIIMASLEATGTFAFVRKLMTTSQPAPFDYSALQEIMDKHQSIFVYPTYWCNEDLTSEAIKAYQQIQLTSAKAGLFSNSSITARKIKDCIREQNDAVPPLQPGMLIVFMNDRAIRQMLPLDVRANMLRSCKGMLLGGREGAMCSRGWSTQGPWNAAPFKSVVNVSSRLIEVDEVVSFAGLDSNTPFLGSGWSPEQNFAWTTGTESKLEFQLPSLPSSELEFQVSFAPLLHLTYLPNRTISVFIGETKCASWTVSSTDWQTRTFGLPPGLEGKQVQIVLHQSDARSPREMGFGDDPRSLGVAVGSLRLAKRHHQ